MKCIQVIGILFMNFCSCAYVYVSLCIKVILSLFMSLCFSCILLWIICIEFVMSLDIAGLQVILSHSLLLFLSRGIPKKKEQRKW